MNIRTLKQNHNDKLKRIRAIDQAVDTGNRDYTEAEKKERDSLYVECEALKEKIEYRMKTEDLELRSIAQNDNNMDRELKKRSYSFANVVKRMSESRTKFDCGFEDECHQELTKTIRSQSENGFLIPLHAFDNKKQERAVSGASALIQDTVKGQEYVPGLYEASMFSKLNTRVLNAMGKFSIPKSAGVTAGWFTGEGGADTEDLIDESDPTYSSINFEPHFLAVMSGWTLKQIKDMSNIDLENILRRDLMDSVNSQLFSDFVTNAGTADEKPIKGLLDSITNNTAVDLTGDKTWTLSLLEGLLKSLATSYKSQEINPKFLVSQTDKFDLRQLGALPANVGQGDNPHFHKLLWENNMICGVPAVATNRMPNTGLIVGDFSEVFLVYFGAMELSTGYIDKDFQKGITRLRAILPVDVQVRRQEAFQKATITRS